MEEALSRAREDGHRLVRVVDSLRRGGRVEREVSYQVMIANEECSVEFYRALHGSLSPEGRRATEDPGGI
ncbi:MAG: hypothetical protein J7L75_01895 [Thermoproteales archaeon]|nr:hypothetical protein [Thermoproteales archaeon]